MPANPNGAQIIASKRIQQVKEWIEQAKKQEAQDGNTICAGIHSLDFDQLVWKAVELAEEAEESKAEVSRLTKELEDCRTRARISRMEHEKIALDLRQSLRASVDALCLRDIEIDEQKQRIDELEATLNSECERNRLQEEEIKKLTEIEDETRHNEHAKDLLLRQRNSDVERLEEEIETLGAELRGEKARTEASAADIKQKSHATPKKLHTGAANKEVYPMIEKASALQANVHAAKGHKGSTHNKPKKKPDRIESFRDDAQARKVPGKSGWSKKSRAKHGDVRTTPSSPRTVDNVDQHMARVDCMIMGRQTYEYCASLETWPYPAPIRTFVLSRTMAPGVHGGKGVEVEVVGSIDEAGEVFEREGVGCAYVDEGEVVRGFLRRGWVDEMFVTTAPVVIGSGRRLFGELDADVRFTLVGVNVIEEGMVSVHYRVVR